MWIKCEDQLPIPDQLVIVADEQTSYVGELISVESGWRILTTLGVYDSTDYWRFDSIVKWCNLPQP